MGKEFFDSNGSSYFIDSAHRVGNDDMLVFIPKAMTTPDRATLVLFLHGHDLDKQKAASLDAYLAALPAKRDLRVMLRTKPVILVHPWVGTASDYGWLDGGRDVEPMLEKALKLAAAARAGKDGFPYYLPRAIKIIGHSGGGKAVRRIAAAPMSALYWNRVTELWVLDGMYRGDDDGFWTRWCRNNKDKLLRVAASKDSDSATPNANATQIAAARLANATVAKDQDLRHLDIPRHFLAKWLD